MADERRGIQKKIAAAQFFGEDILPLKLTFSSYHGVAHAR
jgi:hypothetical protein